LPGKKYFFLTVINAIAGVCGAPALAKKGKID